MSTDHVVYECADCQFYTSNLAQFKDHRMSHKPEASSLDSLAVVAFTAHADAVLALVRKKDAAYGGAWQRQGYMGNLARIMSKTARLQNMLWCDEAIPEAVGESVLDTLHDLMALCAFMASNLEEGNRWGN